MMLQFQYEDGNFSCLKIIGGKMISDMPSTSIREMIRRGGMPDASHKVSYLVLFQTREYIH